MTIGVHPLKPGNVCVGYNVYGGPEWVIIAIIDNLIYYVRFNSELKKLKNVRRLVKNTFLKRYRRISFSVNVESDPWWYSIDDNELGTIICDAISNSEFLYKLSVGFIDI